MLVIHGDKDYRVPVGEALRLWAELTTRPGGAAGMKFLYFPDENHWILNPGNARGLVRDGARLPRHPPARRALAAPRSPVDARGLWCRACRARAGGVPGWAYDPCPAGQAARRRRRHVRQGRTALRPAQRRAVARPGPVVAQGRRQGRRRPGRRAGPRPRGGHRHLVGDLHRRGGGLRRVRLLARHAPGGGGKARRPSRPHGAARPAAAGPVPPGPGRCASWRATRSGSRSAIRPSTRSRSRSACATWPTRTPRWPRCSASPGPAGGWSSANSGTCPRPGSTRSTGVT